MEYTEEDVEKAAESLRYYLEGVKKNEQLHIGIGQQMIQLFYKEIANELNKKHCNEPSVELWIARDKDGCLSLYKDKPVIDEYYPDRFRDEEFGDDTIWLCRDAFPQVTWENSPQRVRIEIMEEGK